MTKRVVVIASGSTEQRTIPVLLSKEVDIQVDVLIPARNRALTVESALRLIRSTLYSTPEESPSKYVLLMDVDGKSPDQVLSPFIANLPDQLDANLREIVYFAYAQWHLEAWFFADAIHLREYLDGRSLGSVDTSSPDHIENPKNHLRNLFRERGTYTARISEEIAQTLDNDTIAGRSPSFRLFRDAVRNGTSG